MRAWLHRFHRSTERVDDWLEARLERVPTWVVWVALAVILGVAIVRRLVEPPSPPVPVETWIGLAIAATLIAGALFAAPISLDRRRKTRRRDANRSQSAS